MIREPAAMGYFYPEGLSNIKSLIASFNIPAAKDKIDAFGIVSPHAGYIYSGQTAYHGYSRINIKNNIIIIGPNHTGLGADCSIMTKGHYGFKDFNVPINTDLAEAIVKEKDSLFIQDELAQSKEHSVEVQIPLLYNLKQDFTIVPIIVSFIRYDDVLRTAKTIFNALQRLHLSDDVLIVASSDMTHYESADAAKIKDDIAIKRIMDLDPRGLYNDVRDRGISMCGFIPVSIMLNIAKMAGYANAELIDYTNSGKITGDYSSVVGYSSIAVY